MLVLHSCYKTLYTHTLYTCMSLNYHPMHTIEPYHMELGWEIQEEQVWEEYGGTQAQSCEETNIPYSWSRQVMVHPTNYSWLFF
jgi:hypothetical protein